jgi:hypothetical protein
VAQVAVPELTVPQLAAAQLTVALAKACHVGPAGFYPLAGQPLQQLGSPAIAFKTSGKTARNSSGEANRQT